MLHLLLSFGALDALIPLLVILILLAAAAGISRGYDIFSVLGIGVLAGIGRGGTSKGSFSGKSAFRGYVAGRFMAEQFGKSAPGMRLGEKVRAGGAKIRNTVLTRTGHGEVDTKTKEIVNAVNATAPKGSPTITVPKGRTRGFARDFKGTPTAKIIGMAVNFKPLKLLGKGAGKLPGVGPKLTSASQKLANSRLGKSERLRKVSGRVVNFRPIGSTVNTVAGIAALGIPYGGVQTAAKILDIKGSQSEKEELGKKLKEVHKQPIARVMKKVYGGKYPRKELYVALVGAAINPNEENPYLYNDVKKRLLNDKLKAIQDSEIKNPTSFENIKNRVAAVYGEFGSNKNEILNKSEEEARKALLAVPLPASEAEEIMREVRKGYEKVGKVAPQPRSTTAKILQEAPQFVIKGRIKALKRRILGKKKGAGKDEKEESNEPAEPDD